MEMNNRVFISYREKEIIPYAFACLKNYFPQWEGWEIQFTHYDSPGSPDFVIERIIENKLHMVAVEIIQSEKITSNHIYELNRNAEILDRGCKFNVEKILIASEGCDTSIVPEDIKIILLKEFKSEN